MMIFFNTIIYKPILNALIILYNYLPISDIGLSVIILIVFVRLILWPVSAITTYSQILMSNLIQPRLKDIKKKHPKDFEAQNKATFALYKEYKVRPMLSFLFLIVQLIVIIALYNAFLNGFKGNYQSALYSFVMSPESINPVSIGFIDLSKTNIVLAVIAAALQYWQSVSMYLKNRMPENKAMIYAGPFSMFLVFGFFRIPSVIALYVIITLIFTIFQQVIYLRRIKVKYNLGN